MRKTKQTNVMIFILMMGFVLAFLVISGRFIYIQATGEVENVSLTEWAKSKRETSLTLPAERGKIYDKSGMLLAYNQPSYRLYAILDEEYSKNRTTPLHVTDIEKAAQQLSQFIEMEKEEIQQIMVNGKENNRFQVEFGNAGRHLGQKEMEEIKAQQIPGIHFAEEAIRYYPNGMFASHIIGFARENEETGELEGVTGIENDKNSLLSGTDGFIRYERDKYDNKLLNSHDVIEQPENGHDIYLTIDQKVQTLLEDVLSQVEEKYEPERITAVVMNPKTGEIIAMGNRPSFNPNNPENLENWYNDVISTPFEPGSTTKMFTWAAAIDAGVYNGSELYKSGKYVVNEKIEPIHDHNRGVGWGSISYDEGFRRSSNVAASKLVWEKIGTEQFLEYLQRFDFDESTGIDLPNEVPGQILYNWPSEKLRTSFGQGSTITPLQQVKAASAIANEGKMMKPYVIDKIVDVNTGEVILQNEPEVVDEPISKETAEQMIELLDSVVNSKDGTGKPYRLDDYTVIGKTGTAQIPNPNGKGYLKGESNNIFSFLGMAPKNDPQLLMHVSVTKPKLKPTESGSAPVSFIFKNVIENGLHYLNIEPDKEQKESEMEAVTMPEVIDKNAQTVEKELESLGVTYSIIGEGKNIVASNFEAGESFYPTQRVLVFTDSLTMPNMKGWSTRDVLTFGQLANVEIELEGSGFVSSQSIKAGKKLKENDKITVQLTSPIMTE